jgi:predicted membrane-bound spermidine synthase
VRPPDNRSVFIYLVFFATGAAALAYEIVWTRWLELLLGTTTHAATAVLAAFMGGLALGGLLFGRLADRVGQRLALYGWLEIAIGLYALAFPALLSGATGVYLAIARSVGANPLTTFWLRFGLALVLVLIPTTFMGGTLPILVRHFASRHRVGRGVAWLYFLNSAGAAIGCALAGFVTIGHFGLTFTSTVAALVSVTAGLVALALRRHSKREDDGETDDAAPAKVMPLIPAGVAGSLPTVRRVAVAAVVAGAAAMAYEIGWFRLLSLVLGSSSDAFTLMLATFIGGLAIGSLWAAPRIDRWADPAGSLARIQLIIGMLGLLTLSASALLPHLSIRLRAAALGSYPTYQAMQLGICALLMILPTFLMGVSFPLMARVVTLTDRRSAATPGRSPGIGTRVGGIAAWTTTGNILGTLVAGLVLVPVIGIRGTFTLAAAANLGAALAVTPPATSPQRLAVRLAVPAVVMAALAAIAPGWDLATLTMGPFRMHELRAGTLASFDEANRRREIVFLREDAGATVSVERQGNVLAMRVNGKPDASDELRDMLTQRLLGHYPMLFHPDPQRVMIVGLGSGVTTAAVLAHPMEAVTVAEISPGVVEASRWFERANRAYWNDPRVRLRVEDARNVLLVEPDLYDVVISEPSNLWMSGVASLYTEEFYRLVRSRMHPGGIFVQWLHSYEMTEADLKLVLRTLRSVFPHATVFRSAPGDLEILASDAPLEWDFDRIERSMARRAVRDDLTPLGIVDLYTLLTNQEITEHDLPGYAGDGVLHVDDWPLLEKNTPRSFFTSARVTLPEMRFRVANRHTALKRYLADRSPTPDERYNFAAYNGRVGKLDGTVIAALEGALRDDPSHRPAMRLLASALASRERFDDAATWMRRATETEAAEAEDYRLLSLYLLKGARERVGFFSPLDLSDSLEAMERCVALAPEREDYRKTYAAILAEAGRAGGAPPITVARKGDMPHSR